MKTASADYLLLVYTDAELGYRKNTIKMQFQNTLRRVEDLGKDERCVHMGGRGVVQRGI